MARISGIDLPKHKRGVIGLTYIYGIGPSTAARILTECGVDFDTKVEEWNDDQPVSYTHLTLPTSDLV